MAIRAYFRSHVAGWRIVMDVIINNYIVEYQVQESLYFTTLYFKTALDYKAI